MRAVRRTQSEIRRQTTEEARAHRPPPPPTPPPLELTPAEIQALRDTPHHYETKRPRTNKDARNHRDLLIAMLIQRDGNHCYLCQKPFPEERQPCIDHIIPISLGGTNEPHNVALACFRCNSKKGSLIVYSVADIRTARYIHPANIGR